MSVFLSPDRFEIQPPRIHLLTIDHRSHAECVKLMLIMVLMATVSRNATLYYIIRAPPHQCESKVIVDIVLRIFFDSHTGKPT